MLNLISVSWKLYSFLHLYKKCGKVRLRSKLSLRSLCYESWRDVPSAWAQDWVVLTPLSALSYRLSHVYTDCIAPPNPEWALSCSLSKFKHWESNPATNSLLQLWFSICFTVNGKINDFGYYFTNLLFATFICT